MTGTYDQDPLDLAEQLARVRRAQTESDRFHAEQRRIIVEAQEKYDRDRWLAPVLATVTAIGAVVAAVASVINLLRVT